MRIDLHTHSDRSDGTDPPGDVIALAARSGLDVVALTDHDTSEGWDEAARTAAERGIGFVPGMEISCSYHDVGVHLLAYLVDPTYEPLAVELQRVLDGRASRLPATVERLREVGVDITADDVRRHSRPAAALGRPHVADALIEKGVVATRDEAFDRYLAPGRPGYVKRYAADLVAVVELVCTAGGVPVLAHPWGRHSREVLSGEVVGALAGRGLAGLEVDHVDHDDQARAGLRDLAADLDLIVTGSSDFHGEGKLDCPLGGNLTAREEFERLIARAESNAAASGRPVPEVALP